MLKVCLIRDIKADTWFNPFVANSIGGAIRSFGDEVQKSDGNPLSMHPDDYELYVCGDFHSDTGIFDLHTPQRVSHGSEFKKA